MELRPYQQEIRDQVDAEWARGHKDVIVVLPCGGGKTAIAADAIHKHRGVSIGIAHREVLVGQMSRTLGHYGIHHRIIGPSTAVRNIISSHMHEFGRNFVDPRAQVAVASVDTIMSWLREDNRMRNEFLRWAQQVTLWFTDECHHLIRDNKWGQAVAAFPNARGLGVTATPERADGKGLGRHADGVFDVMVEGPTMRDLITGLPDHNGVVKPFLTDYRIFCPPSDLDLAKVNTGADGDYIRKQLALKTKESNIMGHVVEHYIKLAHGKLGVTFAPDVETASMFVMMFNNAGVPAELVTAKTPDKIRVAVMKRFVRREILQLVSVDIFSEGFDMPAVEVVSFARATQSFGLYVQQFGRVSRLLEGKTVGIIIDHVGNVLRHGLPDRPRAWTLDRRDKKCKSGEPSDTIPTRNCVKGVDADGVEMVGCSQPYEAFYSRCPYCGCKPVPSGRTAPEMVDGALEELDPETLAAMRGEVAKVDMHPSDILMQHGHMGGAIAYHNAKKHEERRQAQARLRESMGWWGAWQTARGYSESEVQRLFYFRFKVDMMTAWALGRSEAEELAGKVQADVTAWEHAAWGARQ